MKASGRPWLLAALASLALGALAEPASAADDHFVKPPHFTTGLRLAGSHGYEIAVVAASHKRVTLTASKGLLSATYSAPGRATSRRIVADFGALGRISVRFEGSPVQHARKPSSSASCEGRRTIHERGIFRGAIRFEGERRFTAIESRRAKGTFLRSFRRVCERKRSGKPHFPFPLPKRRQGKPELTGNTLVTRSGRGGRSTEFALSEFELTLNRKRSEKLGLSIVFATTRERVGRLAIAREYVTLEDGDALLTSDPGASPVTATVALPKPFSGTAAFQQNTGSSPTWAGSLGVWLPGAGTVPLAGAGFEADLCQAVTDKQIDACERGLFESLGAQKGTAARLSQGSGSHSQAFWDARLSWSR